VVVGFGSFALRGVDTMGRGGGGKRVSGTPDFNEQRIILLNEE